RIAVSDDPFGPYAEHSVGHLLIGCDPASSVWPPPELGERGVEASCEGGQHDLGVELPDSLLLFCHSAPHCGPTSNLSCTIYGFSSASGSTKLWVLTLLRRSSICVGLLFRHLTADVSSVRAWSRPDTRGANTGRSDPGRTCGAQRHRSIADCPLGTGRGVA